jgi:hypothetical protein
VGIPVYVLSGGASILLLAAVLAVLGAVAYGAVRWRRRGDLLAFVAWAELVLGLPGSLAVIYLDGEGPLFC